MKVKSQFKPSNLLKNPHLQTILTQYLGHKPKAQFELMHEVFELSDGDFLDLYFVGSMEKGLVLLMHGILGDIDSHYSNFSFDAIVELGLGGVFVRSRGAGEMNNRTPKFFNAGDARDLNEVVLHLQERFPNLPLFALGYSLGGIILTKWLAEYNQNNPLKAAMAVSIPFDLAFCVTNFEHYPGKLYADYMIRNIRKKMVKKLTFLNKNLVDIEALKKVKTFPEFDNLVTAPLNGYKDASDYYQKGSPRFYLKDIKTPLLIVHALDDPFMTPEVVPNDDELSDMVTLEISEYGGHLGFIEDIKHGHPEYWLKNRIMQFLSEHM